MNYTQDIKTAVEFIEGNLKSELSPAIVARKAGYSVFHFCRVFHACMDMPVMEYVRQRRLSRAAMELFAGGRALDIAIDYGFQTQSGFTKAFRREFGYTPTQYVARLRALRGSDTTDEYGGILMDVKIIEKPAFKVAGYGIKTNIAEGNYTKDIAAFWDSYDTGGWECKLYEQLQPPKHGEVGLLVPDSKDASSLTYVLGVIVDNFDLVTDDMITVEVPAATYAVFTTPPVDTSDQAGPEGMDRDFPRAIRQTWKYIFEEWFKDSGYEYDQGKLDFEYYDERCHFRPDTVMDIYIPIKSK